MPIGPITDNGPDAPSPEGLGMLTALELRDALASGQVSAREAAGHYLGRIEALNPSLGSFLTVTGELALAEAARADDALANGRPPALLHGMPLAQIGRAHV